MLPSRKECLALLRKYDCPDNVVEHILVVEKVALTIADMVEADKEIVSAGALLHDIGRCKTHSTDHLIEGARIIEGEGISPAIICIVQRHMGAGLDEKDRLSLGFPPGKYTPMTLEEKIVAHADTLVSDISYGGVELMVLRLREHGFDRGADRVVELHRELSELAGVDLDRLCRELLSE